MAGTGFDPTTLEEWVLLYDVRAIVARLGKLEPQFAENLIRGYIQEQSQSRPLTYKCLWPEGAGGGRGINPLIWGFSNPVMGFYCPVDFGNSTVTDIRFPPEMEHGSDVAVVHKTLRKYSRGGQELFPPIGFPYQLRLVRLRREDVIAMLRAFGFLPPPASESPAPVEPKRITKPRGRAYREVFAYLKDHPPKKGEDAGDYLDRVCGCVSVNAERKTISNLVSIARKELGLPPIKRSSRDVPRSRPGIASSHPGSSSRKR
jgi:hypothetical protein